MVKLFLLEPGSLFRLDCKAYRLLEKKGGKALCLDTNEEVQIATMTEVEPISVEEIKKCCGKNTDCEKAEDDSITASKSKKVKKVKPDESVATGDLKDDSAD